MKLYSAISFNFLVVGRFRHLSITLFILMMLKLLIYP